MSLPVADIRLPLWLVVSQWTLLFALGWLVIVMYRQVAYLQLLKDAGSERDGLPIGEKAPAFDCTLINQGTALPTRFEPRGHWSLLLFADPGCASCETALQALEQLAPTFTHTLHIQVVTSAELSQIMAVEVFTTTSFDISHIRHDVVSQLYRTRVTPFAFLIDPEGIIRAKGIAGNERSLRTLMRKVDPKPVNVEFVVPQHSRV
jgi:hypothetical protein